jgi:hypothetical protein
VVVVYFLYLLTTAALLRAGSRPIRLVPALAALTCGLLATAALLEPSRVASVLRDWLPGIYVLAGYWATGLLYRGPNEALEARLQGADVRVFARLGGAPRVPRLVRELLECAYLFCYPLVPAGIAVLYATGQRSRSDAYWTLVLASSFAAYAVLPWAGTRPPRSLEKTGRESENCTRSNFAGSENCTRFNFDADPGGRSCFQRVNLAVLARGSIQVNTFPSGHAASAWAVALFMTTVPRAPWPLFVGVAAAIGAGAVIGRYHYLLDVLAGVGVALIAFVVQRLCLQGV